tara:strand:+ start:295 stop:507 length:213 start_codon:yes stop_codon:yes gene_type:complete
MSTKNCLLATLEDIEAQHKIIISVPDTQAPQRKQVIDRGANTIRRKDFLIMALARPPQSRVWGEIIGNFV